MALVVLFAARAVYLAGEASVTIDEFVHLPAGLVYLRTGDFRLDWYNPPLARMLVALPVLALGPALPLGELEGPGLPDHWKLGLDFQAANGPRHPRLYLPARLVVVGIGVGLLVLAWRWAAGVWGPGAGLAALALLAFDPGLIAHSAQATTDLPVAAACFAALAALRRLLERGGAGPVVVAGLALGAAQLTKVSALALYPAALVAWAMCGARRAALGRLALACGLSLVVLNAGYGFAGSLRPLASHSLRGPLARLPRLDMPVFLPSPWLEGFDRTAALWRQPNPVWLNGEIRTEGRPWWMILEVLALKLPLGELGLGALALAGLAGAAGGAGRATAALAVAAGALFLFGAMRIPVDPAIRYVLVLAPLLALGVAAAFRRWPRAVLALLALVAGESLAATGREYGFYHVLAGGPGGGMRRVAGGNLDMGQDLRALARLVRQRRITGLRLAHFSRVDPRNYGLEATPAEPPFGPGWYAISANYLLGLRYPSFDPRTGGTRLPGPCEYCGFRSRQADGVAGTSLYLFHLEGRP